MGDGPGAATRAGAAAVATLLVALALWESYGPRLPGVSGRWEVALVACVLIPASLMPAYAFRWFAGRREALPIALTLGVAAVLLYLVDTHVVHVAGIFNVTKILALTFAGLWFLRWFETLSWVVLVAAIIPIVDTASVYRGPTKVVIEDKPTLFDHISISFALPGHDGSANLGPPDVFFFALFLAAAVTFGLRVRATWLAMVTCLGATIVATYWFDLNGLPALPGVCLGFLGANADLLVGQAREWRAARDAAD
jgi:hypothetical protein